MVFVGGGAVAGCVGKLHPSWGSSRGWALSFEGIVVNYSTSYLQPCLPPQICSGSLRTDIAKKNKYSRIVECFMF